MKSTRRALDGVLLLDKDAGPSSNTALQRAKRLFNAAKAGHTGTLDPMATGLLPICFGEATKFSSDLLNADKVYDAVIALGTVTTTGDAEGTVVRRAAVQVSRKQVEAALARFRGSIEQVPPMHSALKHQGRPLYAYAREGTEIVRAPRAVTIVRLDLVEFGGDLVHVEVACSKGTYIRTLAADVGDALSCGGHLARLRRLRVGPLDLSAATTLEALEQLDPVSRDALLQPVDSLVQTLPAVVLEAESARRFASGQVLRVPGCGATGEVRVYAAGRFVGVGTVEPEGTLAPRRLISTQVPLAAAIAPANERGIA
jgi:tRNA pseudouridine55 synthase